MASLKDKAVSGILWSLLQYVGGRGITFLVTLVLARLLTPKEFGLIGMLMIFIQVSQALVNGGFNQALIQKKNTDEQDYSSVFYINLAVSILIYFLIYFCAPIIASFYSQPVLSELSRVLCLVFVVNAFSYVQEARFTKTMQFKKLMLINLPSVILGGAVSIILAVMNYGVWSIVALQLITTIFYAVQIWIYSDWYPTLTFNLVRVKKLFSFGSKLMISNVIDTVYQNIYLVVIGRFFPLSSVGFYQHADNMVRYPAQIFSTALNKVAFPVFASLQDDNKRLREGYKKIIQQLLFWLCPTFILSGVLAEPLFRFVFTEKWVPAVPYFRWLCVIGILYPINLYNLNILNVKGRSDLYLKLGIIKKILITIGIIISVPFGIDALLAFQALYALLGYFLNSFYSGRFIQYPVIAQLKDIMPIVILGLFVGATVLVIDYYLAIFDDWVRLIGGLGFGGVLYLFIAHRQGYHPYLDFLKIFRTMSLSRLFKL